MPDLKISGRQLTDLEAFILGTDGIVDQAKALECLVSLIACHEAMAIRAARDQWAKDHEPVPAGEDAFGPPITEQVQGRESERRCDHETGKTLGPPPPPGPRRNFVEHPPAQDPVPRPRMPSRSAPKRGTGAAKHRRTSAKARTR